jgi:hypothetical protein
MGCLQLFILPHTLVGCWLLLYAVYATSVCLFGKSVPGRVVARDYTTDDGSTSYHLVCEYRIDGKAYRANASASDEEYRSVSNGTQVDVRLMPFLPGVGARPLLPGRSLLSTLWQPWLFALFWNAIVSVFVLIFYVGPWMERRLVARGEPAAGRIVRKETDTRGDSPTYYLHFEFAPATAGSAGMVSGRRSVEAAAYDRVRGGDRVTVLYDPNRPKRSVLYEYADYEVR